MKIKCKDGICKASTILSLDLCPEFMRDGGGADLNSISHFTTIFANFRGYKY